MVVPRHVKPSIWKRIFSAQNAHVWRMTFYVEGIIISYMAGLLTYAYVWG